MVRATFRLLTWLGFCLVAGGCAERDVLLFQWPEDAGTPLDAGEPVGPSDSSPAVASEQPVPGRDGGMEVGREEGPTEQLDGGNRADAGTLPTADPRCDSLDLLETFDGPLDPQGWSVVRDRWQGLQDAWQQGGGPAPELVGLESGSLSLAVTGDRYAGEALGLDAAGQPHPDGRRTGAGLVSRESLASGRLSVRVRLPERPGVALLVGAVHLAQADPSGAPSSSSGAGRHELSVRMEVGPTAGSVRAQLRVSFGARPEQFALREVALPSGVVPGGWHQLTLERYTGGDGEDTRADLFVDGSLVERVQGEVVPVKAGRVMLAAWPAESAGVPDFDTAQVRFDDLQVRSFGNTGDRCDVQSFPLVTVAP